MNQIKKKRNKSAKVNNNLSKKYDFDESLFFTNDDNYMNKINNKENKIIIEKELTKDDIYELYNYESSNSNDNYNNEENKNNYLTYDNIKETNKNIKLINNNYYQNEKEDSDYLSGYNTYKDNLNLQLLDILRDKRQKDELRERQLEQLSINDPRREILKKQIEDEKKETKFLITKKNEEIEQKLYNYEMENSI